MSISQASQLIGAILEQLQLVGQRCRRVSAPDGLRHLVVNRGQSCRDRRDLDLVDRSFSNTAPPSGSCDGRSTPAPSPRPNPPPGTSARADSGAPAGISTSTTVRQPPASAKGATAPVSPASAIGSDAFAGKCDITRARQRRCHPGRQPIGAVRHQRRAPPPAAQGRLADLLDPGVILLRASWNTCPPPRCRSECRGTG